MKDKNITRRDFVKTGSALAALTIVPRNVLGGPGYIPPSDQITMGVIGTGKQSIGLANRFMELEEAVVVAGSDVDFIKLDRFKDLVENFYRREKNRTQECRTYEKFEELLDQSDIDAVIIATPDHWHGPQTIMAARKGKDIYCEKPLSHTISEGREMVEAVRKNNRVLQTGSMQRSWKSFRDACTLVRNGYIGEIETIKVSVGDPAVKCTLPEESFPYKIHWDRWLGPAPKRGYHPEICPPITDDSWAMWRKYEEYGGGILADWGAHMFDIAQWGLGMDDSGPVEIIPPEGDADRGLTFRYGNGVTMTHEDFGRGYAVRFIGTEGEIDISRGFFETRSAFAKNISVSVTDVTIEKTKEQLYHSDDHHRDFIDSIKSRKPPVCDAETGHRSASVCHLGNIGYKLRRPLKWDPLKEEFINDKEANDLRGKTYRKPYTLTAGNY